MFKHSTGMNVIDLPVSKRQGPAIRMHKLQPRMHLLQKPRIVNTGCCDPLLVWVPVFQVVGMAIRLVAGHAEIEDCLFLADPRGCQKSVEHPAPLESGNPDRNRIRSGYAVSSVYPLMTLTITFLRICLPWKQDVVLP